ncbi:MAG TPA: hypothetical protein VN802_21200 [Stellaceae bacterium]|nr:hypothetical protein [Stellaceae bacterium]
MPMSNDEARQTLTALEKLICVAELMELGDPEQRAALQALRGRRAALRRLVASRQHLRQQKIVCLAAWRDAPRVGADRTGTRLQPI